MNTTGERPNRVKDHRDESLRDSRCSRLVRARAIYGRLSLATDSLGVFLQCFEGDCSGDHSVSGAALTRSRINHHDRVSCRPQARELLDRYAAHSTLVKELMASPPLQRQDSSEDSQNEDGPQPAERRQLGEYTVYRVVKYDAERDAGTRPQRRTDQVVEHETAESCPHDSRHRRGHGTEPGNELRKREYPGPE